MQLPTIRRLYFYLVAFIGLMAGLAGVDGLLAVLSDIWLSGSSLYEINNEQYIRDMIARNGGLLLVATPIFLLHWRYMKRLQGRGEERRAALRKFFLYAASAVAVIYIFTNVYELLQGIIALAFGTPLEFSPIWPSQWLYHLFLIGVATALQIYFHRQLIDDGDYGTEQGGAGTLRRLYQAIIGLAGLTLLLFACAGLLEIICQALFEWVVGENLPVTDTEWWQNRWSDNIAKALIGAVLIRVNWLRWLGITNRQPQEAQAALRRLYLYIAVIVSAFMTLIPAVILLNELLLILLGTGSGTWAELLEQLASPLAYIPVGLVSWYWHWRILSREASAHGESKEGAVIRRIYYYIVSAIGLGLFWFGTASIVQVLLDWLFTTNMTDSLTIWVDPLANGLSLIAIGTPIWALHWQAVQTMAVQESETGQEERASGPRKIYLYGVALVGTLLILFYLAQVLYRFFLLLLGDPTGELFAAETTAEVAGSLIAAVFLLMHIVAIRRDSQLGTDEVEVEESTAAQSIMPTQQRAALIEQIAGLEAELAEARQALAALDGGG